MPLLQQAAQLLSETPGSLVYHLVTLLTLQVVFAVSRNQWQRDPGNRMSQRMTWAAGTIFLARTALLLGSIVLSSEPARAAAILPPLEQGVHTLTAVLIVWAFVDHSERFPRFGDTALLLTIIVIGVMAASSVQFWQSQISQGEPYSTSAQAKIWGIMQMVPLGVGFVSTIVTRRLRRTLNPIIIGLLLLAHIASFANYPEVLNLETDIAFRLRLGHLIVFPLWAALAYRRSLAPLLIARQANQPLVEQLRHSLLLSTQVINAPSPEETLYRAIDMVTRMLDAVFVGIAVVETDDMESIHVISNQPQIDEDQPRQWTLDLTDGPAFGLAIEQRQSVQFMPNGLGARQLNDWYEAMGLAPMGALLIQPPSVEKSMVSLLMLAGPQGYNQWSERDKALASVLADYLAQAIDNSHIQSQALFEVADSSASIESNMAVSGRLIALEEDSKRLMSELDMTRSRLQRAEEQAAVSSNRARDLAATLQELEGLNREQRIAELENEIEALRESLIEAEEAMALAAAGEGGLSTEWVMLTITRYSGQLEEAQARILALETELEHWEKGPASQVVSSLVHELRTPMTSIAGYADLLMGEQAGLLEAAQRDFVQRIKSNSERMGALLEHIVQVTKVTEQPDQAEPVRELVNVQEAIETAISAVITQIREKKLLLELDVAHGIPELEMDGGDLSQIMTSLLGNACQSSGNNGRVAITARAHSILGASKNGKAEAIDFVKLTVSDSGEGIGTDDRPRVFDPQYRADNPLISGLGDTGVALAVARTLTEDNGGRIWVDSEIGVGSTFSTLFPINLAETGNTETNSASLSGSEADGTHDR
jgi:signal transduction histidine kinase